MKDRPTTEPEGAQLRVRHDRVLRAGERSDRTIYVIERHLNGCFGHRCR